MTELQIVGALKLVQHRAGNSRGVARDFRAKASTSGAFLLSALRQSWKIKEDGWLESAHYGLILQPPQCQRMDQCHAEPSGHEFSLSRRVAPAALS
jgi:hypothetical protein